MPIYKKLPKEKQKARDLPFYRPIDHVIEVLWKKRMLLLPYALVLVGLGVVYIGIQYYNSIYNDRAAMLLEKGELAGVASRYDRSDAALVARVKLAEKALKDANYDEALKLYRETATHARTQPMVKIAALQNEALILIKKGSYDEALSVLGRAVKDPQNALPDYTRLLIGRTYELKGDSDKAKETYLGLSESGVKLSVQNEAKERLSWLTKY